MEVLIPIIIILIATLVVIYLVLGFFLLGKFWNKVFESYKKASIPFIAWCWPYVMWKIRKIK